MNEKRVLCLPGGADYCRWQAGFVMYLADMGYLQFFNLICGTSGGGLNAITIGKYLNNMSRFRAMWSSVATNKDMYDGVIRFANLWNAIEMASQFFKDNKGKSILKPTGLYNLIEREFSGFRFSDSQVPILVTTTNMSKGKTEVFSTMDTPEADAVFVAKATSAIPAGFPGVEKQAVDEKGLLMFDDKGKPIMDVYSDGGILKNNPVSYAIDSQATHIMLIGATSDAWPRVDTKNLAINLSMRSIDIMMHENEEQSWLEKEKYELHRSLAPDKYPPLKINAYYPEHTYGSGLNVDPKRFEDGYDYAKQVCTLAVLKEFFE